MDKRERLEATIKGEQVDRVATALWRHWPGDDQRADDLAAAHLAWQERYDWDFIKISPSNTYCLKDWGIGDQWKGDIEGKRTITERVIQSPDDWTSLKVLNPTDGSLGDHLGCLDIFQKAVGEQTPYLMTIYSPLSQARELAGEQTLIRHMRQNAGQIHHALQTITDTTIRFIQEARKRGLAGIFYEIHLATYNSMAESEYEVFGRPYDLQLLRTADELWFNVVQVNGSHPMFSFVGDYAVAALSWPDRQSPPSVGEAVKRIKGAAIGGVDRWALHDGDPEVSLSQARDAWRQTSGRNLVLSVGGSMPITTPWGNIQKFRDLADELTES